MRTLQSKEIISLCNNIHRTKEANVVNICFNLWMAELSLVCMYCAVSINQQTTVSQVIGLTAISSVFFVIWYNFDWVVLCVY